MDEAGEGAVGRGEVGEEVGEVEAEGVGEWAGFGVMVVGHRMRCAVDYLYVASRR